MTTRSIDDARGTPDDDRQTPPGSIEPEADCAFYWPPADIEPADDEPLVSSTHARSTSSNDAPAHPLPWEPESPDPFLEAFLAEASGPVVDREAAALEAALAQFRGEGEGESHARGPAPSVELAAHSHVIADAGVAPLLSGSSASVQATAPWPAAHGELKGRGWRRVILVGAVAAATLLALPRGVTVKLGAPPRHSDEDTGSAILSTTMQPIVLLSLPRLMPSEAIGLRSTPSTAALGGFAKTVDPIAAGFFDTEPRPTADEPTISGPERPIEATLSPSPSPPRLEAAETAPSVVPAAPLAPTAPSHPTPNVPAARAVVQADGSDAIQRLLAAYEDSYNRRDAEAVAAIWNGVDRRALGRAFNGLASQVLSFDQCDIDVDEAHATARCSGALHYVPKIGDSASRVVRLAWTIDFSRGEDGWLIARVDAR